MRQATKLLQPAQISRAVYRCGSLERKLLFFGALCVQQKRYTVCNMDFDGYVAEFSISAFAAALGVSARGEIRNEIRATVNAITECNIKVIDEPEHLLVMTWLQLAEYNEHTDTITLHYSEPIGRMFFECRSSFSLLSPRTIGALKSFYAIRYYELALSYRGYSGKQGNPRKQWYFELTLDELRQRFDVSGYDNYDSATIDFYKKVIKQPIDELNAANEDFFISLEKIKDPSDRRRLHGVRFTCKAFGAEGKAQKISAADSATEHRRKERANELRDIEAEIAPIERMRTRHPREFAARVSAMRAANPAMLLAVAESETYDAMAAEGF